MSAISSRPRVRKVAGTALPTGAAFSAALLGAAVLGLSAAARTAFAAFNRRSADLPLEIAPLPPFRAAGPLPSTLTPTEKIQVSTLVAVSDAPCLVDQPLEVGRLVGDLGRATSATEAGRSQRLLLAALEAGHQRILMSSVSVACANATRRIGCTAVEVTATSPAEVRVIGTSAGGRRLVSEIRVDRHREVHLETEVIGVSDGSCHTLLDRFDEALEAEGIRSGPRGRRSTGGVCQLAAAKDAVARKLESAVHRLRRLNQSNKDRTRV